jgi:cytochrome c1
LVACLALALSACGEQGASVERRGVGNLEAGRAALAAHDCGVCHRIPGVRGARGLVGPPLDRFGRNVYIAGRFPNTPEMLVRWIVNPPALEPLSAMPAVGVDEADARDIAAYLLSLQ